MVRVGSYRYDVAYESVDLGKRIIIRVMRRSPCVAEVCNQFFTYSCQDAATDPRFLPFNEP